MLVKTKGIIFRSVKYRESSLILDIYTRELGLMTYIINGVRKKNARTKAAILQLMNLVEMVVYDNGQREINRIKEVRPAFIYREIPFRIEKSSVGTFILEIVRKTIKEKEQNYQLFDFLESVFLYLDQTEQSSANFHLGFLVKFAEKIGFQPSDNFSQDRTFFDMREGDFVSSTPFHKDFFGLPATSILNDFLKSGLTNSHLIDIEKSLRHELLDYLISYYRIQIGDFGEIRSLEVFKDIFS